MEKLKQSYESEHSPEHEENRTPERKAPPAERVELKEDTAERMNEARREISHRAKHAAELKPPSAETAAPSGYFQGSQKKQSYKKTMGYVRSHLTRREQTFSRIIHLRAVEAATDLAAKTVFRATPLLFAGLFSVVVTGAIYLLARYRGYGIPGSGWLIVSFAFGYIVGLLIDMARLLLMRRKA